MEIKVTDSRIYVELEGGEEAYISFRLEEERKVIVVRTTFVPKAYRGKGIAAKLTEKLLELAQQKGYRISPLCSYTRKYLERKRPDLIVE
ncbi:GNAT family N-acetyltransferase [Phorcysia thermohydrogeniphila]|uniref:N-acetyltransferase domain-containing protein n=1 Tax=Phorcysia thermohydrogeniphila TaxID=936138 RepID=A0A4R1GBQ9_9BACT|nr:GNAT family N-acetyltransferase [Phorcysia thermohydrogeniphila]TCK05218.1 hypothetical protein CLV27_0644 [Phorcysia thermohydrogeniphila]